MIFNTAWFLVFFAVVCAGLAALPGRSIRFYWLLACSAVFHWHFAGPAGVAPIIVMAVAVYLIAGRLHRSEGPSRKRWLWAGLAVPVAGLVCYKYRVFVVENLSLAWPGLPAKLGPWAAAPFLPLAISFFTFEFVHYLVDVYRGGEPFRRPDRFALFCIYFPSIASGPIKRYEDFDAQVAQGIAGPAASPWLWEGLAQVLLGYFKKLVVADTALGLARQLEARGDWDRKEVCLLMGLLSVRILFDFSGYSDMAIGFSKIIGIRLPANFNFPYLAGNPSEFWRRWHMSLSNWVRDYLYIPLGGSRRGGVRTVFNALLAMAVCGLWHGAAWNFALWGLYHGVGLAAHNGYRHWRPAPERPAWWSRCLCTAGNFLFVSYGWLLFFYPWRQAMDFTHTLLAG